MECTAHAFGFGHVVAQIAHFCLKEDITTQHNLPFVRYPNSTAILFTHISNQSTQPTLLVPLVPFLFGNVHITFCPQNTQVTKSCIRSSPQFQRRLTFHWCRSSMVEYVYCSITGFSPQFFRQSTWVKHRTSTFHNCGDFLALLYHSVREYMASQCVMPCSSNTFCTASQLNSLPPSDSRPFVTCPAVFTSFRNFHRQSATSLFVVMKNTTKFRIIIFEADVIVGTTY